MLGEQKKGGTRRKKTLIKKKNTSLFKKKNKKKISKYQLPFFSCKNKKNKRISTFIFQ